MKTMFGVIPGQDDAAKIGSVVCLLICSAALAGCRTPEPLASLPARHSVRSEQLLVLSDFKLPADHELIHELKRLRTHVSETLQLPIKHEEVVVYLFTNEMEYRRFLSDAYPNLPHRRAYFVGTPHELAVYTYWGSRIQEDLRHEYTHGLLHAGIGHVPLWIDEGLAEYFEVAETRADRVNTTYANRLVAALGTGWTPDIERLEKLENFSTMTLDDYQEAWAWVHFIVHNGPETRQVLIDYLDDLRTDRQPVAISVRLGELLQDDMNEQFADHVASLKNSPLQLGSLE